MINRLTPFLTALLFTAGLAATGVSGPAGGEHRAADPVSRDRPVLACLLGLDLGGFAGHSAPTIPRRDPIDCAGCYGQANGIRYRCVDNDGDGVWTWEPTKEVPHPSDPMIVPGKKCK